MACILCARGLYALCEEGCAERGIQSSSEEGIGLSVDSDTIRKDDSKKSSGNGKRSRRNKRNDELKDPHSTGRKRAALLFPLDPESPCEWRGKTNCGGGQYPIVGCIKGKQEHRHHGPDKNTLNNSPENVHRICDDCHNIWHSQNDPTYDSYWAKKVHQPRPATNLELIERVKGNYVAAPQSQEKAEA